jgi:hypothetical protein
MTIVSNTTKRITSTMNWDNPFLTILAILAFIVFIFGLVLLVGWVLSFSWNYVMPEVFGLPKINIAKAWALLIVSSMLIKSDIKAL